MTPDETIAQLRADLVQKRDALNKILTDKNYEGSVAFWMAQHDAVLSSAQSCKVASEYAVSRARADLTREKELNTKLLTDENYEGGVAYWISKHDAMMWHFAWEKARADKIAEEAAKLKANRDLEDKQAMEQFTTLKLQIRALEKELSEAIVDRNHNYDEAWRFAADRDSHQRLAIAAETRLAALQAHADQMAKSWAYIAQKGTSLTKDDVMAGLATLRAYRAFTAEGQKTQSK